MTMTNHALTGAVIALVVKEPLLAAPLALASHFVLDVLPHFGMHTWEERQQHSKLFKGYFVVEAATLMGVLLLFWLLNAPAMVYVCSFVATAPDFIWVYRFIGLEHLGKKRPPAMNWFNEWHSSIQTRESIKPGIFIETVVTVGLIAAATRLLI